MLRNVTRETVARCQNQKDYNNYNCLQEKAPGAPPQSFGVNYYNKQSCRLHKSKCKLDQFEPGDVLVKVRSLESTSEAGVNAELAQKTGEYNYPASNLVKGDYITMELLIHGVLVVKVAAHTSPAHLVAALPTRHMGAATELLNQNSTIRTHASEQHFQKVFAQRIPRGQSKHSLALKLIFPLDLAVGALELLAATLYRTHINYAAKIAPAPGTLPNVATCKHCDLKEDLANNI